MTTFARRAGAHLHSFAHRGGSPGAFDATRSEAYDRVSARLLGSFYRHVAADVVSLVPAGGALLDVGTGSGRLLHHVARLRDDVQLTGVDVSPDMVVVARRVAAEHGLDSRLDLGVADVTDLPQDDASVDVAVATLSMHHWTDVGAAVEELSRVLRPGGRLVVYDFRFAPLEEGVRAVRRAAGLIGVTQDRVRPAWYPLAVYTRLGARRTNAPA